MTDVGDMRAVRDRLVMAALNHVPFEGWSRKSLLEAARDEGFDATMAERAFPGGVAAVVEHFADLADRRLLEEAKASDLEGLRRSERIVWLVRKRIEPWAEHRESVRRAVTFLSLPTHSAVALRASWRTADTLWYASGDTATDFSYYTKRASLAAVYTATLLYWLEDASEDCAESWSFLRRRLADALRITKFRVNTRRRFQQLPNPLHLLSGKATAKRRFGVRQA